MSAERERVESFGKLENGLREASDWYLWGPYVSERQWGTVREDYSANGDAWNYVPHDHARSRAYRWGEDGLAGFCDIEQRLCLGLALWNGHDPILKERIFGLTGAEANHGEDAKEYWWYLDAVPSHVWNRWRYHYPRQAYPYQQLIDENRRRGKFDPEYELLDTGVFDDDRYWIVDVVYAKAAPLDLLMCVRVTNPGPDAASLHVLPTAWFRNTWSWDARAEKPNLSRAEGDSVRIGHPYLGELELVGGPAPDGAQPSLLFCENETNVQRLFGAAGTTAYPKDGINDHVVGNAATVNPEQRGTKCAFWYQVHVGAGETVELRLRLRPTASAATTTALLGSDFERVITQRQREADEFYAEVTPAGASEDEARVMRQAFAGLLWSKQFYYYDVAHWLDGDPSQPAPPPSRLAGRNSRWRNFDALDIMSMPDKWEYPWFAAWDLAFHCVALAHVDPAFAKYQLVLVCREWFQSPSGALPAYEWDFGDVNPPVQAWAALEVFGIDGGTDLDFLSRIFDKLLVNFTWWINREDEFGANLFEGGFLGLDNIGPLDRSHLPVGGTLQQSDATGWMAYYALVMGIMAAELTRSGKRPDVDLLLKFLEHFAAINEAMETQDLWDEEDGLSYDRLVTPNGEIVPLKVRSMVGIIPALAAVVVDEQMLRQSRLMDKQFAEFLDRLGLSDTDSLVAHGVMRGDPPNRQLLLGVVPLERLKRMLSRVFDESEFLSRYGVRAISAYHREHPYVLDVEGLRASVDYEPAESTTSMFGGNSNWRGPIWFPLNYLLVNVISRYHRFLGDDFTLEYPTGSGRQQTLDKIADDLRDRLISIFLVGDDGRRPCFGPYQRMQQDPNWKNNILFNEYFHGDTGAGLGASHQTGWTGLIADIIRRRHGAVEPLAYVLQAATPPQTTGPP
ncbi:MAG: glucosidase [Chloroflexi bacterium]|nr:glucosidase [Chloroflexota bacterium]